MVNATKHPDRFFVVGGTLDREATSYVQRPADDDLFRLTLEGEYCNVLAARQTGKSSLMVRTAERLKSKGVKPVIIDLTSIGSKVSAEEWYFGIISYLNRDLKLNVDEQAWWYARKEKSPVQRFSDFLHEVILKEIPDPIVIFIDEIDSTLKLEFTDDFFAAIRATYNARSQNADSKRLTFVLLGVARPADLIKDRTRTPYNIGAGIDATDFQMEELDVFESVFEKTYPSQGRQVLEWVLEWTGGQPYLTQKLSSEVVRQANGTFSKDKLDDLVEQLFLGDKARAETNLRSIRDQTSKNPHLAKMLRIYKRVLSNKQVIADERSIEQNELKLAGLVKTIPNGTLQVRNRIYAHIFGQSWVKVSMPVSTAQRLTVITSVVALLALTAAGYFYYQQQTQTAEIQARTYVDNFNSSNSPEVKITSLAGLFRLGGQYTAQARGLFNALDHGHQLALFDLTTPANVGNELVVVIGGVYQNEKNTPEGNALLRAMANILEQTPSSGATSLTLEINAWIDGREAAGKQDFPLAISLYTRAFEYSQDRESKNVAILMERAVAYTALKQYGDTLNDYDTVVKLDSTKAKEIENIVLNNTSLASYWRDNSTKYPNLLSSIVVPTIQPVSTSTPTAISTPTQIGGANGLFLNNVTCGGGDCFQIIYLYNLVSHELIRFLDGYQALDVSPDGRRVLLIKPNRNLYILDLAQPENITLLQQNVIEAAWLGDSEWIGFIYAPSRQVYIIHPDGSGLTQVTHSSKVAITLEPAFNDGVFWSEGTVDSNGGRTTEKNKWTKLDGTESEFTNVVYFNVSRDGKYIYAETWEGKIKIIDVSTGTTREISLSKPAPDIDFTSFFGFQPLSDDKFLIEKFYAGVNDPGGFWIYSSDGKVLAELPNGYRPVDDTDPPSSYNLLSPDGNWILIGAYHLFNITTSEIIDLPNLDSLNYIHTYSDIGIYLWVKIP